MLTATYDIDGTTASSANWLTQVNGGAVTTATDDVGASYTADLPTNGNG